MSKTTQVLKLESNGRKYIVVKHEDDTINPFWVYSHSWGLRGCGYGMSERKRLEIKYGDMKSCLFYIAQHF